MTARSSMIAGLTITGALGLGITSASAQGIYVDPYAGPYGAVVAPDSVYVVPPPIVAPIVRERTVVVSRPAYVTVPAYRAAPVPSYDYYVGDVGYAPGW